MNDTGVFQSLSGATDPWKVEAAEIDTARETVTIELGLKEGTVRGCPVCRRRMHVHGWERRRRRHFGTRRSGTRIEAEVPMVRCDEHGARQVRVPRAEPRARFTMLFGDVAIALLQGMTTAAVARRLGIGRDEADGIRRRAVRRGWRRRTARVMKHPRVDEKHAGHGHRPMIVSCVDDGKARVVHVAQGKDQAALDAFRRGLTDERPGGTGPVAMDMSGACTGPVPRHVPGGRRKPARDRCHVAQQMNKAVDEVRRSGQAAMAAEEARAMKGGRYWWLGRPDHPPRKVRSRFRRPRGIARRTAKAREFKELPRKFRECPDRETGRRHLREWLRCALRSTLAPVRRVARMCGRHPGNLPAFFAHRSTNASAEAVDSRIRSLINQACGYRDPRRLVTEIFFHYGDPGLAPRFPR